MNHFIIYQLGVSANRILLQMLFCYPFIYLLLPRFYAEGHFKAFAMLTLLLIAIMYYITYYDFIYIWSDTHSPVFFDIPQVKPLTVFQAKYFAIYSNLHCTGTFVSLSLILTIRYYKSWYKKEQENAVLIFQNAQAELQLLKAQVHPHFLFNTLNNIYSLMLDDYSRAITVLNELSGMVLYMTHEGTNNLISLNKEIKMLQDYIGLEKIRYGDRLEMRTDIQLEPGGNLLIAPLLMIPFVENSFKHGASKTIEQSMIHLSILTKKEWLEFEISNQIYPGSQTDDDRIKIGLKNVKKRLQILYPDRHTLQFQTTDGVFTVTMKIYLGNLHSENKGRPTVENKSIFNYA